MPNNFFELNNVSFIAGGKNKVNNVNLSIEKEGEIVCLLGPSGIGKTTILRTIAGLEKVKDGEIVLNNKILSSKNKHVEPEDRNVALSFQENCLFPHYNVEKNINLGVNKNSGRKKINSKEIVKFLNLEKILNKFPHEISAGEAQRASLARSLVSQPDLLLLDEPLSNVDQNFKEEIQVELKQILNNSKILLMGVAYKKDISDMRESPAIDIAELLLDKDVDISYYDPYVEEFRVSGHIIDREVDTNSFEDYDMLLVLTPHSNFAQLDFNNLKTIIFDTTGSDFINSTERI